MSKNSEYVATYGGVAQEQMRRYGIPASVILAQGILESSSGQSELSRKGNNHFGIKCTAPWLQAGGEYLVYTDDRPNEKFCAYGTAGESYEHHSLFLKENARYKSCFSLPADDYRGWTEGLQKAGYATGKNYASSLQQIIEKNGLQKYDQQVMEEMRIQGKSFGTDSNVHNNPLPGASSEIQCVFPLERKEFLLVTSPFGMRQDPMDTTKQQMHKGIDIRADHDKLLATENGGKVIAVNENSKAAGGKSVTVEYTREGGSRLQIAYSHLDSIQVKVGDVLKAGQQLGISGDTGIRSTGPHLHLGVKLIASDGSSRDLDPASYLAEIAQKGNIKQQVLYNGENLLAKYEKVGDQKEELSANAMDKTLSVDDWMKKLLSSEDGGISMSGDPIMEMITTLFTGLMALATQLDGGNKSKEEQMQQATDICQSRKIDITPLIAGAKDCKIILSEGGKPILQADINGHPVTHVFSNTETNNLIKVLNSQNMPDTDKQQRITSLVNGIVVQQQVSQNYEQGMDAGLGKGESVQIK